MTTLSWAWIYGFSSFTAGVVSLFIIVNLFPYWKNKSIRILILLMTAITLWSLTYGMELISPTMVLKLWWMKTEYFGVSWIGMLLFCFISTSVEKKRQMAAKSYVLLSSIPLMVIALVLTNEHHHLMWQEVWLDLSGKTPALVYSRGYGFWAYTFFSYLLILLATIVLIKSLISSAGIIKRQRALLLVGVMCPWLFNIIYLFGFEELKHFDLTPAAFTISGITFSWALLKYQMLGLIPLAREMLIESMGDPVVALDMNDRVIDLNKAAENMLQMDRAEHLYKDLRQSVPGLFEQIEKYRSMQSVEVETDLMIGALSIQWNLRIFPLLNRKEKQVGRLIILRDIRDRKKAEAALKESEKMHRIILEASPNPIVFYNEKGEATYINPAFTRVFGWYPEELLGKRIDFVPEEHRMETQEALQKTFDGIEGEYDFITRRITKSGDILDVSIKSALYRPSDNSGFSMVVNITDITKIKKIEYELRNTKDYIRSIVNSMPSGLIGLNAQGIVTEWNSETEKLTGVLAELAEGNLLKDVFPQISQHITNVHQIIEEQKIRKETKINLSTPWKTILTDITIYPILSDTVKGAVIRIDDISDRVRIEEMMIQSEKMLSVGGLAAGMAHEINNPLAGMLQNIQVIRNRLQKELPANIAAASECGVSLEAIKAYMKKRDIFSMIELITDSGYRAAKIVENMLAFSRKSNHRKSTNYLHDIMEATIELMENDFSMKKKYDFRSIKIIRQYQEGVLPVSCEKTQIQQVFLNILKNGAEAMAVAGTIFPQFVIRCFKETDHVVMEIEDTGPGIAYDIQKRIFEPFFTTKEVGVGTGLGLSVSYFIIKENHGGILSVDSTPGRGACFIIKLPG